MFLACLRSEKSECTTQELRFRHDIYGRIPDRLKISRNLLSKIVSIFF